MFSKELIADIENAKNENQSILDFVVCAVKDKIAASQSAVKVEKTRTKKYHQRTSERTIEQIQKLHCEGKNRSEIMAATGATKDVVNTYTGQKSLPATMSEAKVFQALELLKTMHATDVQKALGVSQSDMYTALRVYKARMLMAK